MKKQNKAGSKRLSQAKIEQNDTQIKAGHIRKVKFGNPKLPLIIHGLEIESYVLEDGTRVIAGRGVQKALGLGVAGGDRFLRFINRSKLAPFISDELKEILANPIKFDLSEVFKGNVLYGVGFEASFLPAVCEALVRANNAGVLKESEKGVAERAETLGKGLSRVGIIALIDEHTGYQKVRGDIALRQLLLAYVSEDFLPWFSTFPPSFYQELFRLRGWHYDPKSVKRPKLVGKLTLQLVYGCLPKDVVDAIKAKTPKNAKGSYTKRLFQSLTAEVGKPHLEKVLTGVITLMKVSPNWDNFMRLYARAFGGQQALPLPDDLLE